MPDELPTALGSALGIRHWTATKVAGRPTLRGNWSYLWQPGVNTATCGRLLPHRSPDKRCMCGFYAYWSRWGANMHGGGGDVCGIIKGYGKTRLGTKGYRCEKAELVALCPRKAHYGEYLRTDGPRLASRYGVPWYESTNEMLRAHPVRRPKRGRRAWVRAWAPLGAAFAILFSNAFYHNPLTMLEGIPAGALIVWWMLSMTNGFG